MKLSSLIYYFLEAEESNKRLAEVTGKRIAKLD